MATVSQGFETTRLRFQKRRSSIQIATGKRSWPKSARPSLRMPKGLRLESTSKCPAETTRR
jgi:hypothetical protein